MFFLFSLLFGFGFMQVAVLFLIKTQFERWDRSRLNMEKDVNQDFETKLDMILSKLKESEEEVEEVEDEFEDVDDLFEDEVEELDEGDIPEGSGDDSDEGEDTEGGDEESVESDTERSEGSEGSGEKRTESTEGSESESFIFYLSSEARKGLNTPKCVYDCEEGKACKKSATYVGTQLWHNSEKEEMTVGDFTKEKTDFFCPTPFQEIVDGYDNIFRRAHRVDIPDDLKKLISKE